MAATRPAFFAGGSEIEHWRLEGFGLLLNVLAAGLARSTERLANQGHQRRWSDDAARSIHRSGGPTGITVAATVAG